MAAHGKSIVDLSGKALRSLPRTKVPTLQHRLAFTRSIADSDTATLPDGRKIGFAHYGANDGPKVFYLHGNPGSRLEGIIFEPPATKLGIDIIAVDRPGIGLSSPHTNRTIIDHARDIKHLAALLGHKEYHVVGVSGGGPYAIGCALDHRSTNLRGVAVVAGIGPPQFGLKGMALKNRLIYRGFQYAPRLLHLIAKPIVISQLKKSDEELLELSLKKVPEKDRHIFSDPDVMRQFITSAREHFRQGLDAWMRDGQLLGSDWGFRIEDIAFSPLKLWYGTQDVNIASCVGPELRRRLGEKAVLHMEDESHMSLVFNCREKILADLVEGR